MKKNELPPRLVAVLDKRGWNLEIYGAIYNKCATAKVLGQDEYRAGMDLAEIGFMTVARRPLWKGHSYQGQEVSFQSYVPL